jgi:ankyrin repeat protein
VCYEFFCRPAKVFAGRCISGNLRLIRESIESGANVNHSDHDGQTALAIAAYHGYQPIVEYLVRQGANVNTFDRCTLSTPLALAVRGDNIKTVKCLLENGADVNLTGSIDGEKSDTPLSIAAEKGNLAMVQAVISKGADVNIANNEGNTPLAVAESMGNFQIVKWLKEMQNNDAKSQN